MRRLIPDLRPLIQPFPHVQVLSETVLRQEMTENQAIKVLQDALFHNANRIYSLGLEPKW